MSRSAVQPLIASKLAPTKSQGSTSLVGASLLAILNVPYSRDVKGHPLGVVASPLRAGLVDRIGDYPWWDAVWL